MLITSLLVMIFTYNKLHEKAGISAVLLMCNTRDVVSAPEVTSVKNASRMPFRTSFRAFPMEIV